MPLEKILIKCLMLQLIKKENYQFYILLRVDNVITKKQFINNLKKMSQEVRSEPAKRNHKVMMPNDIQEENKKARLSKGIPIDSSFYKFINKLDENIILNLNILIKINQSDQKLFIIFSENCIRNFKYDKNLNNNNFFF